MVQMLEKVASLDDAHDRLTKELDRARDEWRENGSYDVGDLLTLISQFVHVLQGVDGGYAELERRANLTFEQAHDALRGAGSPFEQALFEAIALHGPYRRNDPTRTRMAHLRTAIWGPLSDSEYGQLATVAELLRDARDIPDETRAAMEGLRVACCDVAKQLSGIYSSGCRTLLNTYLAMGSEPPNSAKAIVATLRGGTIGGALLEDARSAADSLASWVHAQVDEVQPQVVGAGEPEMERITDEEAEAMARKLARGNTKFVLGSKEDWAAKITKRTGKFCSPNRVLKLPLWIEEMEKQGRCRRRGPFNRTVPLTPAVQAVQADRNATDPLENLIAAEDEERARKKVIDSKLSTERKQALIEALEAGTQTPKQVEETVACMAPKRAKKKAK